ncbi:MAG: protein kinase [Candidatus Aminicenantes bacterium]|nr:protein kinase [Candidatus Aminicenantes bacterium]
MKCSVCQAENRDDSKYCSNCGSSLGVKVGAGAGLGPEGATFTRTLEIPLHVLKPGTIIAGKYRIIEEIGQGGMGVVYKAEDLKLKRCVALKFLPPHLANSPELKERFLIEAQAAAALSHPNICVIHEVGESEDRPYIAMEFVEGETLRNRLKRGPLKPEEAVDIISQVAAGLGEAHNKGIIHRDIKSANIMVTPKGQAKVMDFGLAKLRGGSSLTRSQTTLGTVAYMSPEQARGEEVDQRTDIWSLGVVLYELLAGRLPFQGDHDQTVIYSILHKEPESLVRICPSLSPELEHIAFQALTKKAADRYQTMEEFQEDLAAVAEGLKPLKARSRPSEPEKSVAVLPFINDSPDQENTYFINGVMEEILSNLQKIKALRVISRTSVEQYRDSKKSVREIAEELGVNYIVEGSAQKYGDAFRLRVQLIKAEHEAHLWGESFKQKITDVEDIFDIQIRIAKSIAEELRAVISPEEKKLIEKIPVADLTVYDQYLKARSYVYDGRREALNKAIEYLNSAIEKNPGWAPLYAGLAEAWLWMQQNAFEQPSVAGPKIIENLNKALALDPDLGGAHYLSGMIAHLVDWDWERSEREFLKALAINPNDGLSRGFYAQLLLILQRKDEALAQNELALSLDPLNPMIKLFNIGTLLQAGECQASLSFAEEALAEDPDNFNLNQMIEIAAHKLKQYDKAIRAVRHVLPFPLEDDEYRDIERIYSESGIVPAYEKIVERLEKYAESNPVGPHDMAFRYLIANKLDKAMDWIEKGYEMHDPLMTYITTPLRIYDPLTDTPGFLDIVKKMKLPLPK